MCTAQEVIKDFESLPESEKDIFLSHLFDKEGDIRQLKLLKEAQSLAKVGSWQWDVATNKVSWSDELYKVFGKDKKTFEPNFENYLELIHPEEREMMLSIIQAALTDHKGYQVSHRIKQDDGSTAYVFSKGYVHLVDGEPSKLFGTAQDITESKLAEQKFKSLLESAPDAMLIVNKKGVIELTNKQTELLFGYTKAEIVGQKVEFLIPKRFHSKHRDNRESYQNNSKARSMGQGLELYGLHKSGKEIPVEISLSPINNNHEKLVAAAIRDITNRKNIEKRQNDLYEQLELSNNELENFAYIVSHDLKAPLRSIATVSEWIQEDLKEINVSIEGKNWEILISQIEKMYGLIDGILEYSRIGRITEDIKSVNLNAIVKSVYEIYIDSDNIEFKNEQVLPIIKFESTRIQQVFQNLIANAVKAIGNSQGEISVGFTEDQEHYTFYVKDNGPGIEEKYFDKIFVIFHSLALKGGKKSTGIGLTIVKKIIESNNGKIWVESEIGKGATFYFNLPKVLSNK